MKILIIFCVSILSFATYGQKKIVFLGDSLTEGYGVSEEQAFPFLIQKKLDKKAKHHYKVINGGVSGSTTASGLARLRWFLKAKPDFLVIALGANDGLRGIKIEESRKNLRQIVELAQKNQLKIFLCEMQLPTNYGEEYRNEFNSMFKQVQQQTKVIFVPFILEGVGGLKEMNLEDGIHPNPQGHERVAENIYKYLEEHL